MTIIPVISPAEGSRLDALQGGGVFAAASDLRNWFSEPQNSFLKAASDMLNSEYFIFSLLLLYLFLYHTTGEGRKTGQTIPEFKERMQTAEATVKTHSLNRNEK